MNIAVIGSGGREHALVWRLLRDGHRVVALPGSDGIPGSIAVDITDDNALLAVLHDAQAELVVIGPEAPLARGLADVLRVAGLAVVGPGKAGARLEASKSYAKAFMQRHGVATAPAVTVHGVTEARQHLAQFATGVVVKFDGLAAGKGVVVCESVKEAEAALQQLGARYGDDATLVLEDRLRGREISVLALVDGTTAVLLPPAQDHKRLLDGDLGPNTGGMGAYCPVPWCTAQMLADIETQIVAPTLRGLQAEAIDFRGVLYFGVMVTAAGPRLLEYNTRFGDPETQVVVPQIGGDFGELLRRTATANLAGVAVESVPGYAVGVVLAAPDYPESPKTGLPIHGLEQRVRLFFHAGTRRVADRWETAGGRVITCVGQAETFDQARTEAYAAAEAIAFDGAQRRSDIGKQAMPRRVAVLFSGRGSNLGALLQASGGGCLRSLAQIVVAVTNVAGAAGCTVAQQFGVPIATLPSRGRTRAEFDADLVSLLRHKQVELVVLAGFMRVLSSAVIEAFPGRIVNIHPADTRQHQGLHGYLWAWNQGLAQTWVTVHLVDASLDTGPILVQTPVDLHGAVDVGEVERRGLAVEHATYAQAIAHYVLENL